MRTSLNKTHRSHLSTHRSHLVGRMAATCATALTLTMLTAVSPATAAEVVEVSSAPVISDALSGVAASKIDTPAPSVANPHDIAVTSGDVRVSVPRIAGESVQVNFGDTSVSVQLPSDAKAGPAVETLPGVFTYPSTSSFANTVVPLDRGVQLLTTLVSSDAPTSFAYDFTSTAGTVLAIANDGSATVADSDGRVLFRIASPWAVDAAGVQVPTWFEAEGLTLVQVVDHSSRDRAYPVVADPRLDSGFGWTSILFNRHETNTIAGAGIVALGGATAACGAGGPAGIAACSLASAAIGATAVYAKDNGQCVGLSFWGVAGTTVGGWNPFLHNGRDCR